MNNNVTNPSGETTFSTIGRFLLEMGKISPQDTDRILLKQKDEGIRFGDAAQKLGLITEEDLRYALSRQFSYTYLPSENRKYSKDLIAAYDPFSPEVESFRMLRSQLLLGWFSEGFKTISVVGASKGDGVTFIAANLAVSFSQLGKKTLLIDANLRDPRLHEVFDIKQSFGLTDILINRTPKTELHNINHDFPNLSILSAGTPPPNPLELLSGELFMQLIEYASTVFDVIIIDNAEMSCGADSQIVASVTKGAVLVSRINHTSYTNLKTLRDRIRNCGSNIVAAVINKF